MLTDSRAVHPENTNSSRVVRPSGKSAFCREAQSLKAYPKIEERDFPNFTSFRFESLSNAAWSIYVTLSGMVNSVIPVHSETADHLIPLAEVGIIIDFSCMALLCIF